MRQNSYVLKSNKNQIRDPKARSMCSLYGRLEYHYDPQLNCFETVSD